jgi:hypothetical protein
LFGEGENALESGHAVLKSGFVIHPIPVSAEADQVHIPGLAHEVDVFGVPLNKGIVQIKAVPSFHEADFRAIAHRRIDLMAFEDVPFRRTHQIDRRKSEIGHHGA